MARDRQIFVRTTPAAHEWVQVQAQASGLSEGALVSEVLEAAARQGWVLRAREIAVEAPLPLAPVPAAPRSTPPRGRGQQAGREETPAPVPAACGHSFPDVRNVAGTLVCRKCG
jgi:hypothetical protein